MMLNVLKLELETESYNRTFFLHKWV